MSTYVMSDIHGCFDEMNAMFKKIGFSEKDTLICAGDYIDRGPKSYEVLQWMEHAPENVIFLCGNHDAEFVYNVDLMEKYAKETMDRDSNEETLVLYVSLLKTLSKKYDGQVAFDYYGTIGGMLLEHAVTLNQLTRWSECIKDMSFVHEQNVNGKKFIVVHAGYTEQLNNDETDQKYDCLEDFYLYARDDAYMNGGAPHATVIAGHTPTIFEEELPYNHGEVYRFYDEEMDCIFYDIDCGCAYREQRPEAKLACIRLEDEAFFYV